MKQKLEIIYQLILLKKKNYLKGLAIIKIIY